VQECIAYGTGVQKFEDEEICSASSLAGPWDFACFYFNIGSNTNWTITQTDKRTLLLYLDQPQNADIIKKILTGTLQVLEKEI